MSYGFKSFKNTETNDRKVPAHHFWATGYRPFLTGEGASVPWVPVHWNLLGGAGVGGALPCTRGRYHSTDRSFPARPQLVQTRLAHTPAV